MATVKKTLSLDVDAWRFTEQAAAKAGMSPSAWLSRAARQQAIRQGYCGGVDQAAAEVAATADEDEAASGEDLHAAG